MLNCEIPGCGEEIEKICSDAVEKFSKCYQPNSISNLSIAF